MIAVSGSSLPRPCNSSGSGDVASSSPWKCWQKTNPKPILWLPTAKVQFLSSSWSWRAFLFLLSCNSKSYTVPLHVNMFFACMYIRSAVPKLFRPRPQNYHDCNRDPPVKNILVLIVKLSVKSVYSTVFYFQWRFLCFVSWNNLGTPTQRVVAPWMFLTPTLGTAVLCNFTGLNNNTNFNKSMLKNCPQCPNKFFSDNFHLIR